MSKTIAKKPALPFLYQIHGGLKDGHVFVINGVVKYDATRVEINLKCGRGEDSDHAVHFNPRFDDNAVIFNWLNNGQWGREERHPMCFRRGEKFQLTIEVDFSSFHFMVNGGSCGQFRNNIPLPRVVYFEILKGIHVEDVELRNKKSPQGPIYPPLASGYSMPGSQFPPVKTGSAPPSYRPPPSSGYGPPPPGGYNPPPPGGYNPPPPGGYNPPPPGGYNPPPPGGYNPPPPGGYNPPQPGYPSYPNTAITNPSIPFKTLIHGGVHDGKMIYVSGRSRQSPYRFDLNLRCSKTIQSDIAFHFDVRFNPDNCVVRNTKVNGQWGHEERQAPIFPFQPGASFDIIIKIENSGIMVAVNGTHFVKYAHRIHPFTKIDTFDVDGDVNIHSIRFA